MNKIGETKRELLRLLANPNHTAKSQSQLGLILGITQQSVSEHLDEMEEKGLIEIDSSPNNNDVKELTRDGYKIATCGNKPVAFIKDSRNPLDVRLHRLFVKFKISNPEQIKDTSWVERHLSAKPCRTVYDPTNDSYKVLTERYNIRITRKHVFVRVEDLVGADANNLKNRALIRALDARDWLQANGAPVEIEDRPIDSEVWVNEQHVAIFQDPFAELVKNESSLSLPEVRVCDSSGNVRLKMDQSKGRPELESEKVVYGEDDIKILKSHYRHLLEDDELAKDIREAPEKVEELKSRVDKLEEKVEEKGSLSVSNEVVRSLEFSSKWVDNHGNLMGYSVELEKPVRIVDKEELKDI